MELVQQRISLAQKSVHQLHEILKIIERGTYDEISEILRDSAIQRFEFSMDTFYNSLQSYLQEVEKIEITEMKSPRAVFRCATQANLFTKEDLAICIQMVEDRNRTSHTYNEDTAEDIFQRIPLYHATLQQILDHLNTKL